ncbi:hypothetical protein Dcar01_03263 [Deinococcus carri]|uniref:Uncharacterized protein n=1 Tax=Deinococcus carri TaxID=1211323 RepID=A0ABP9WE43_9DEIO
MRETEQYLKRATRGLWGKAAREARLELRGAVEDKVYRYRLLGLDEAAATRAALRDLGDPSAIARDLSQVHTLPQAGHAALLAGMAALLGVQALAQVPTVNAAPLAPRSSCKLDTATLQRLTEAERAWVQAELTKPGGRERLEAHCRDSRSPNELLKFSDLIAALKAGGVGVQVVEGTDAFLHLKFPGISEPQALNLNEFNREIKGERYVPVGSLLGQALYSVKVPLRLTGLKNPTFEIGPARMRLGTADQPIYSTNLYSLLIWDELFRGLKSAAPDSAQIREMGFFPESGTPSILTLSVPVLGAAGTFYAIVYGQPSSTGKGLNFTLRAAQDGQVAFPAPLSRGGQPAVPRLVATPAEFFRVRDGEQPAALLYRVDTADLRNLKLVPVPAVPASQLKLDTQP